MTKFTSFTLLALCASLVCANPAPKGTKFLATFDDVPGSSVLPELDLVPNPYRSLQWPTFDVYGDALTTFKYPSGNQTAASFIGQSILQQKTPSVNVTSKAPAVKSFDLDSLYLACVISSQTGVDPAPCTLVLSGTKKAGGAVVTEECSYSVVEDGENFKFCQLPSTFKGLVGVGLNLKGVLQKLTTVTFLDSVAGVLNP